VRGTPCRFIRDASRHSFRHVFDQGVSISHRPTKQGNLVNRFGRMEKKKIEGVMVITRFAATKGYQ
jgi:hypothetical protein